MSVISPADEPRVTLSCMPDFLVRPNHASSPLATDSIERCYQRTSRRVQLVQYGGGLDVEEIERTEPYVEPQGVMGTRQHFSRERPPVVSLARQPNLRVNKVGIAGLGWPPTCGVVS